jgi:hypothetical protein
VAGGGAAAGTGTGAVVVGLAVRLETAALGGDNSVLLLLSLLTRRGLRRSCSARLFVTAGFISSLCQRVWCVCYSGQSTERIAPTFSTDCECDFGGGATNLVAQIVTQIESWLRLDLSWVGHKIRAADDRWNANRQLDIVLKSLL